jgi:hypothetical protein
MRNWCASISAAWRLLKKLRRRRRPRRPRRRRNRRRSLSPRLRLLRLQLWARSRLLVARRLLLQRRLPQGPVLRRMLPQLAPRRLRLLHVLPHLLVRRQLIQRRIRPVRHPRRRSLQQLHLRLQLQQPLHVPELRLLHLRRDPAPRCGLQQHREARLQEHVLR